MSFESFTNVDAVENAINIGLFLKSNSFFCVLLGIAAGHIYFESIVKKS
jgi:hypothetical protein